MRSAVVQTGNRRRRWAPKFGTGQPPGPIDPVLTRNGRVVPVGDGQAAIARVGSLVADLRPLQVAGQVVALVEQHRDGPPGDHVGVRRTQFLPVKDDLAQPQIAAFELPICGGRPCELPPDLRV